MLLSEEGIFLYSQIQGNFLFFSFCQGCNLIDIFAPYGNQSNNWRIWKISLFWFFRVFYFPPKERTVYWNQSSHVTHVTQSTSNSAARFTHGLNLPHSTRNYIFFLFLSKPGITPSFVTFSSSLM